MRRRQQVSRKFLETFRYRIPPYRPGAPAGPGGEDLQTLKYEAADFVREVARAGGEFIQDEPQLRLIVRDSRGHLWSLILSAEGNVHGGGVVGHEDFPVDPRLLGDAMGPEGQALQYATPRGPDAQPSTQGNAPLWVRIPQGQAGEAMLRNVARLLAPTGNLSQDGIRALLNSPQFQQLFQGGQLAQGATQMLSHQQLVGILIHPNLLLSNPEIAKVLLIAQGLPPGLIQSIPDRAIAGALQALLQAGQNAALNPLHFLQTVAGSLTLAGIPVQEIQDLLLNLLHAAQQEGIAAGDKSISPQLLQQFAAKLMAANNPQLLGLNQMVQQSFGQGLAQIFNAFIRVFLGGALMQSQQNWPQAVPNDRMLAELGALFGSLGGKQEKTEKKRSKRQAREDLKIDDPAFRRVERKEDVSDEPREQPEDQPSLDSIFLNVDE